MPRTSTIRAAEPFGRPPKRLARQELATGDLSFYGFSLLAWLELQVDHSASPPEYLSGVSSIHELTHWPRTKEHLRQTLQALKTGGWITFNVAERSRAPFKILLLPRALSYGGWPASQNATGSELAQTANLPLPVNGPSPVSDSTLSQPAPPIPLPLDGRQKTETQDEAVGRASGGAPAAPEGAPIAHMQLTDEQFDAMVAERRRRRRAVRKSLSQRPSVGGVPRCAFPDRSTPRRCWVVGCKTGGRSDGRKGGERVPAHSGVPEPVRILREQSDDRDSYGGHPAR